MDMIKFFDERTQSRFSLIRRFFRIMGVRPLHVILPFVFSFLVAGLEGISLALLVPLTRGMVSDFNFIRTMPVLNLLVPIASKLETVNFGLNKVIFLLLVALIIIVIILKNIFAYLSRILVNLWHGGFRVNMYRFVFDRFMKFGKLYFDRSNQGAISLILNYSTSVLNLLGLFEYMINNSFMLMVYLLVMFKISWNLTLISLLVFPVLHFSLQAIIHKLWRLAELKNESQISLGKKVFNILTCIPLIKAYSKEDQVAGDYNNLNEKLRALEFSTNKIDGLIEPIKEIISTGFLLLMASIVALILAKDRPTEISIFVVFFYAARKSLPLFNVFNEVKSRFNSLKPPIRLLAEVMQDNDKFFVKEGRDEFNGLNYGIEFNNLNFSYIEEVPVLKGVSFFAEAGKVTAIVGPTGSGKTTLISLLMRFYDCPAGSIMVDKSDIRNFTGKSLRRHIALVSQDVLLFNDSIRNNMLFGLDRVVSESELIEIAKKARIYDFIISLPQGFDTEVGDRGLKLSGGEKQRVAIARALLKGSEILILDEATSSLDSMTECLIQEAINEAVSKKTAIVIAHRLSTIKNADKIVVLENGRIVEQGSLKELIERQGRFYEYWEAQKFS